MKLVRGVRSTGAEPVLITQASLYKRVMSEEERKTLWFAEAFCVTRVGFGRYEYPSPGSMQEALAAFNEATRRVAKQEGALLVDADTVMQKSLAMFEDDCHYTAAGAEYLADTVANQIIAASLPALRR